MNAYEIIRNTLDIEDVAERYGMDIRRGKACCPFHSDRTPSLSFKNGRFRCFGCGESGDAVDLVAKLYGISLHEAAARINADYNLGIDLDKPAGLPEINAAKRRQDLKKAWKKRETEITDALWYYRDIRLKRDGWVDSTAEYLYNEWEYAKDDERMRLYADWKETIKKIERYVRDNRGGLSSG